MDKIKIDFSACVVAGEDTLISRVENAQVFYSPMSSEYFEGILSKSGRQLSESLCGFLLLDGLLQKNGVERTNLVISRNADGRPCIISRQNIDFSISHSEGVAVCAIALGENVKIGCDVQRVREYSPEKSLQLAEIFMPPSDLTEYLQTNSTELFYRVWTRREAFIKADGGDVFGDIRQVNLNTDRFVTKAISSMGGRYFYSICTL